jgi:hypothetical protein
VDVQKEMIGLVQCEDQKDEVANVEPVLCTADDRSWPRRAAT